MLLFARFTDVTAGKAPQTLLSRGSSPLRSRPARLLRKADALSQHEPYVSNPPAKDNQTGTAYAASSNCLTDSGHLLTPHIIV